jgi:hypothetical protein
LFCSSAFDSFSIIRRHEDLENVGRGLVFYFYICLGDRGKAIIRRAAGFRRGEASIPGSSSRI